MRIVSNVTLGFSDHKFICVFCLITPAQFLDLRVINASCRMFQLGGETWGCPFPLISWNDYCLQVRDLCVCAHIKVTVSGIESHSQCIFSTLHSKKLGKITIVFELSKIEKQLKKGTWVFHLWTSTAFIFLFVIKPILYSHWPKTL